MGPNAGSLSAVAQAEQLRINGNSYFKKDRFGAAIDAYTEVFFVNRSIIVDGYWDLVFVFDKFVRVDCCNSYMRFFHYLNLVPFFFLGYNSMPQCSCLLDESCSMPSQAEVCIRRNYGHFGFALFVLFYDELELGFSFVLCVSLYFSFFVCGSYSDWERVEEDCRRAIQLNSKSVKVSVISLLYCGIFMCLILFFPAFPHWSFIWHLHLVWKSFYISRSLFSELYIMTVACWNRWNTSFRYSLVAPIMLIIKIPRYIYCKTESCFLV